MSLLSLTHQQSRSAWVGMLCVLFGAAAFFAVVGPLVLNPSNIAWLSGGFDPSQHYLGWAFFRQSPWSFPLGLNPGFGMDISSSIVYSDSIPLLALFFKLFATLLPDPFQYFGGWLLLCFLLQAYFAWRLVALLQMPIVATIGSVLLFVFSPVMFWRIGMHAALVAHWLILAALYLNFRPARRYQGWYWALIISVSALVHFYLLTMVLGLWIASVGDDMRIEPNRIPWWRRALVVIVTLLLTLVVMWQAGYFVVNQSATATLSYGISRMNVLAPLDARHWSYVLPSLPDAQGALSDVDMSARTYENFMFWGAGVLLLFWVVAILYIWGRRYTRNDQLIHWTFENTPIDHQVLFWDRHRILYLVLISFWLFALSNQLAIGAWSWNVSLPRWAYEQASMYRASSRFFWPVFYLFLFLGTAFATRHLSAQRLMILMMVCALVQIVDTRSGWQAIRNTTMRTVAQQWSTELRDAFWGQAAKNYQELVRIPVDPNWVKVLPPHWSTFAEFAARNNMQTNSAYLARQSAEKLELSQLHLQKMLVSGRWNRKTLYILSPQDVRVVLEKANPQEDLLATINGHIVFAPGWLACAQCPSVDPRLQITPDMVRTQIGVPIEFASAGNGQYFLQGSNWAYPESWGIWAVGQRAELTLPLPVGSSSQAKRPTHLALQVRALVNNAQPTQQIGISINNQAPLLVTMNRDDRNRIDLPLSPKVIQDGYVQLVFDLPTARRPKHIGLGDDERMLSMGLISATLH